MTIVRTSFSLLAVILGLAAASACAGGSDGMGQPIGNGTGAVPGDAASDTVGMAGSAGASGTVGVGGSTAGAGGMPAPEGPCPGATELAQTVIDVLPECDGAKIGAPLCSNAKCVPNSLVPAEQVDLVAPCDAMSKCIPLDYVRWGGNVRVKTCRSVNDSEGRCISACIPQVSAQASQLPQDVCEANERCAPCYDPIKGTESGACSVGCDPGPTEPPVAFSKCCGGFGVCVPKTLVPAAQLSQLSQDACTDPTTICAPSELTDPTYHPKECTSLIGAEGRCTSLCVPQVAERMNQLPKDICDAGFLCAPCYDPIDGSLAGACNVNGDMPKQPAKAFAPCCSGNGKCVPKSLAAQQGGAALTPQECTTEGPDFVCAPTSRIKGDSPIPCTTAVLIGTPGPGACVPDCFVGGFTGIFVGQSTCATGQKCAPCINPLDMMPTGACG